MAIVRGQWYQWKIYPDQFYKVSVVSSYVQLYPYDTTRYQVIYVSQAYLQANFRLLASAPQNFLLDGKASGTSSVTRANVVHPPVIWGSVSSNSTVSKATGLLDTTLRGRVRQLMMVTKSKTYLSTIQTSGNVLSHSSIIGNFTPPQALGGHVDAHSAIQGSDFTVYPLGGYVASHGSVVQAQAN
jgi:hypothetical protein